MGSRAANTFEKVITLIPLYVSYSHTSIALFFTSVLIPYVFTFYLNIENMLREIQFVFSIPKYAFLSAYLTRSQICNSNVIYVTT